MASSNFKDNYIEYHFSNGGDTKKLPYLNVEIPITKIQNIFCKFREQFGETELIKEYSTYTHNNLELTIFPDGSSFCRKVNMRKLEDPKIPEWVLVTYVEKNKLSNDFFPCKYTYNSSKDVIDVVFSVNENIKIVLKTVYENNRSLDKLSSIEKIGRPEKIKHSIKGWCELSLIVDCSSDIEEVYKNVDFVISSLNNL